MRVLIVRVGAMGDVLHALPAVTALRQRFPDFYIGWAIDPRWSPLLTAEDAEAAPLVDRIHAVPTREWKSKPFSLSTLRQIVTARREMRKEKYDVCVDLQGSIKSAVIGRMAEAEMFLGPQKPAERQARALYRERVPVRAAHVIEQACELLSAALTDSSDPVDNLRPAHVYLPKFEEMEAWCDARMREFGVGPKGFVLLAPTAGWGAKEWPVARYQQLAARLHQAGYTVLVNAGSKSNQAAMEAVVGDSGGASIPVKCSVAELIALTRRAQLVVGGDTGPVHLAAALGVPVVGLYGPTDPKRNGPYFPGSRSRVIRHATSRSDHARHGITEAGLSRITGDEVVAAALEQLGGGSRNG